MNVFRPLVVLSLLGIAVTVLKSAGELILTILDVRIVILLSLTKLR